VKLYVIAYKTKLYGFACPYAGKLVHMLKAIGQTSEDAESEGIDLEDAVGNEVRITVGQYESTNSDTGETTIRNSVKTVLPA